MRHDADVVGRIRSPRFIGRAAKLQQLEAALEAARAGSPSVLLVAGEAGIGKTRLVEEYVTGARDAGARVLVGECLDVGEGALPYAALTQALRAAVESVPRATLRNLPSTTIGQLERLVPALGVPGEPPRGDGTGNQVLLFEAMLELLRTLGADAPVVLVLEDLHWADPDTRQFVALLHRRMGNERLSVVLTYRSDELSATHPLLTLLEDLGRGPAVDWLRLRRFERTEVAEHARAILDGELDVTVLDELAARSDGNPLYLEELLAARGSGADLPEHLVDLLVARVDRLSDRARELVRAAAVGGRHVDDVLLRTVLDRPDDVLVRALREAVAGHVLVPHGRGYAFRHALVREAVERDLLAIERASLHVAWATAYEQLAEDASAGSASVAAARAHHWHAAGQADRALTAAMEAAEAAVEVHAFAEALAQYELAVGLWSRAGRAVADLPVDRLGLLERAAQVADVAGETERSHAFVRAALEEIDRNHEPIRTALLLARSAQHLQQLGDLDGAFEALATAMDLVPQDATPERAHILAQHAQTCMLAGLDERAFASAERALEVAEAAEALDPQAQALTIMGVSQAFVEPRDRDLAIETLERAIQVAGRVDDHEPLCKAYLNLSYLHCLAGRLEEGLAAAQAGLDVALASGAGDSWGVWLRGNVIDSCLELGRWDEAAREIDHVSRSRPTGSLGDLHLLARARLATLTGDLDEAGRLFAEVTRPAGDDANLVDNYFRVAAELAAWQRDLGTVRDVVVPGIGQFTATKHEDLLPPVIAWSLATLADDPIASQSDVERAQLEARLVTSLEALGRLSDLAPIARPWLLTAEAERARLQGHVQGAHWDAAIDAWGGLGCPYEAAYCRFRRSETLLERRGPHDDASATLRAAHTVAADLGAVPLRREIEALARRGRIELEVTTPDATPSDPFQQLGLTRREGEVLELVGDGRTNRQIGEVLFITEKTAERHVSNLLRKLQVSNRVEAAAVAHRLRA